MADVPNYAELVQRPDTWDKVLAEDPDIMHALIGDVLKIVQSDGAEGRVGRRPSADAMSFDEMWATLFPERFSTEAFPDALLALMAGRSQGQFAMRVPCTQAAISQLLSGKREPTPHMMEALARAGGVTAAYFVEWRAWWLGERVTAAMVSNPRLTATVMKRVANR